MVVQDRPVIALCGTRDSLWIEPLKAGISSADFYAFPDMKSLASHWADIDALITWNRNFTPEHLVLATRLKWVHSLSAGVDKMLFPGMVESKVILTSSKGVHSVAMAHHCLALLLALMRGIDTFVRSQQHARWLGGDSCPPLHDLAGKTMAIVGLGVVGQEIARLAKAFGMRVIASKRTPTTGPSKAVDAMFSTKQLREMLTLADVVVVCCPLTQETAGMFGPQEFGAMKQGSWLVNIARGGVVQTDALLRALGEARFSGVGLDVLPEEPLPESHPLWRADRVLITPHVAVNSEAFRQRAILLALENCRRFVSGEPLLNVVDKTLGY